MGPMLEKKKKLNMKKSDRHAGSSLYLYCSDSAYMLSFICFYLRLVS